MGHGDAHLAIAVDDAEQLAGDWLGLAVELGRPDQTGDFGLVGRHKREPIGLASEDADRELLARLHPREGPQVADGAHGVDAELEGRFMGAIHPGGIGLGPGLQGQKGALFGAGDGVPELLGEVGHQGMQHHQQGLQAGGQHLAGRAAGGAVLTAQPGFGPFDVLVAEVVPGELIEELGRFAEAIGAVELGALAAGARQARKDPAVLTLELLKRWGPQAGRGVAAQVHQGKAGGIPELVGEVAGPLHRGGGVTGAVVIEADVLTGAGHLTHQGKAQGIGAITLNQQQRVNAIARGFTHLAVVLIPHQAVDVNVLKGHLAREDTGHHRHPGHPEKDDVEARHQHAGGIPGGQIGGLWIGPAQGGEGPKATGEPGVEHIRVLLNHGGGAELGLG